MIKEIDRRLGPISSVPDILIVPTAEQTTIGNYRIVMMKE